MARSPEDIRQDQISELLHWQTRMHRQTCDGLRQCADICRARNADVHAAITRIRDDITLQFTTVNGQVEELRVELQEQSGRIAAVGESTAVAHDRIDVVDQRIGIHDSWFGDIWRRFESMTLTVRDNFNWMMFAAIGVVTLLVSRLFWYWVLYTNKMHFWLQQPDRFARRRPGADYWQVHEPEVLRNYLWLLVAITVVLVLGIALLCMRGRYTATVQTEAEAAAMVRRPAMPRVRRAPNPRQQPAGQDAPTPAQEPANA